MNIRLGVAERYKEAAAGLDEGFCEWLRVMPDVQELVDIVLPYIDSAVCAMNYEENGEDVFLGWVVFNPSADCPDGCFVRLPELGIGRRMESAGAALAFVRGRCGFPNAYFV